MAYQHSAINHNRPTTKTLPKYFVAVVFANVVVLSVVELVYIILGTKPQADETQAADDS